MAAIPNRYYNSPWIAQAGENLAMALAPPDPQKQLAAQRAKWEFDRAQEVARIQDEDRLRAEELRQSLGDVYNAARAPAVSVGPHSPGEAQYFAEHPEAVPTPPPSANLGDAVGRAFSKGATPQEIDLITGDKYAQQRALRAMMGDAAYERMIAQEGFRDNRFYVGEEGKDRRLGVTEEGKDTRLGVTEEGKDRRLGVTEGGKDRRLGVTEAGKDRRGTGGAGGGDALKSLPAATVKVIRVELARRIKAAKEQGIELGMSPDDQFALESEIADDVKRFTGNPVTSVQRIFGRRMRNQQGGLRTRPVTEEGMIWDTTRQQLDPDMTGLGSAIPAPGSGVLAQPPAPTAPQGQRPPISSFKKR
jgi:hypothetical protein